MLKVTGKKNIQHANTNQKSVIIPVLTSEKVDFKEGGINKDKEKHSMMISASI